MVELCLTGLLVPSYLCYSDINKQSLQTLYIQLRLPLDSFEMYALTILLICVALLFNRLYVLYFRPTYCILHCIYRFDPCQFSGLLTYS